MAGTAAYQPAVLRLYNAGILKGSDQYGSFKPDTSITRAEVAAIVTRMADRSLRQTFTLEAKPVEAVSVSLSDTAKTLKTGDTLSLTATVLPENATDRSVTWTSSNRNTATVADGKVTALAAGSAVITAKTANGKTASCTVTVQAAPIEFSGTGDKEITGVNIPKGDYYSDYTHTGKHNFIAHLKYGSQIYEQNSAANDIGDCSGQRFLSCARDQTVRNGTLEVDAYGTWTIRIVPVTDGSNGTEKGSGDTVSHYFTAPKSGTFSCTMSHNGKHNFIARLYEAGGSTRDYQSLANEIGVYSGSKSVKLTAGKKYFYVITCDGDWSFSMNLDGSAAGSSGSSGSGSAASGARYSAADAQKMYNYIKNARSSLSEALKYGNLAMKENRSLLSSAISINLTRAVGTAGMARSYLNQALILANSLPDVPVDATYGSMRELLQAAYDGTEGAAGYEPDGSYTDAMSFSLKMLEAETASAGLLSAEYQLMKQLGSK